MAYTKQTWTDGVSVANATRLGYIEEGVRTAHVTADSALTTAQAAIPATQKGAASGVATLDSSSKIPLAQIPSGISGTGAVSSVGDGVTQLTGAVNLSGMFALESHQHDAGAITTGLLGIARASAGSVVAVVKALGMFGATAGNWPTARPTTRTDIIIDWQGNTDPGNRALANDRWKIVP